MKKICVVLSLLSAMPCIARADAQTYTQKFSCFKKAELTDAPLVSLVQDQKNHWYVHEEARGMQRYILLTPSEHEVVSDGTAYEGEGVSAIILNGVEDPAAPSSVTLNILELTYSCRPVLKPQSI